MGVENLALTAGRKDGVRMGLTNSESGKMRGKNRVYEAETQMQCGRGKKAFRACQGVKKTSRDKDKPNLPRCGGTFFQGGGSVGSIGEGAL